MIKCDVCGDNMCDENDSAMIGLSIDIQESAYKHPQAQKVWNYFGKTKFNVCYTCWIKSLGIKGCVTSGQKYEPSIEEFAQIIGNKSLGSPKK